VNRIVAPRLVAACPPPVPARGATRLALSSCPPQFSQAVYHKYFQYFIWTT
jgi:hypothetical protein